MSQSSAPGRWGRAAAAAAVEAIAIGKENGKTIMAVDVGYLGVPRVAGRLTAELIAQSPQYMNCVQEYYLDLRAHRIAQIENLGATENQFDSIDFTDNEIVRLDGFPALKKLSCVLMSNNRVSRISRNLGEKLPNLETLILTNNRVEDYSELQPLRDCAKLRRLSLVDNPISRLPNYRLHVIRLLPQLRSLDFRSVRQSERDSARVLGEPGAGTSAAREPEHEHEQVDRSATEKPAVTSGPTPEQVVAIKAAISKATTLEEIARLEASLAEGTLPVANLASSDMNISKNGEKM